MDRIYLETKWECSSAEELTPFELARLLAATLHEHVFIDDVDVIVAKEKGSDSKALTVLTTKINMNQYQSDLPREMLTRGFVARRRET